MKHSYPLLGLLALVSTFGATTHAQQQSNAQPLTPPVKVPKADPIWLKVAQRILELGDKDLIKGEQPTKQESDAIDALTRLNQQLEKFPQEEVIEAYRYMVAHSSDAAMQAGLSQTLLAKSPTAADVRLVRPLFDKWPDDYKLSILISPVFDIIMLRPEVPAFRMLRIQVPEFRMLRLEVPEFREFPLVVLQQGAARPKMSPDLLGQAALLLVVRTSPTEKQAMHEALAQNPEAGGIWNALSQLDALIPAEVQKARQMFVLKKDHVGWRMTLAVALSPYDSKMREIVRAAVEAEIKEKADFDLMKLLRTPRLNTPQIFQLEAKAQPRALMVLRFWELDQAFPYLQRLLRAKNPMVTRLAMPTLAMRAPQEVLRLAGQPNSRKTLMNRKFGLALTGLLHPELEPQAAQLLAEDHDLKEGPQQVEENFQQVSQTLRSKGIWALHNKGILGAF